METAAALLDSLGSRPRVRPTFADIEALPEHLRGEILNGMLVMSPRPAMTHIHVSSQLGGLIMAAMGVGMPRPGGWWIEFEPELHLDVDPDYLVVVPDIAGWRVETLPELPLTPACSVVPDWVCEVLSPGTEGTDRALKLPFYGRAGVRHVWIVDPLERTLEVYENDAGWRLIATHASERDAVVRAAPFLGTELPFARMFGR